MHPFCVSTSFEHDPSLSFSMTIMAPDEEAAVQSVLRYLRMEFDMPEDASYHYRAS